MSGFFFEVERYLVAIDSLWRGGGESQETALWVVLVIPFSIMTVFFLLAYLQRPVVYLSPFAAFCIIAITTPYTISSYVLPTLCIFAMLGILLGKYVKRKRRKKKVFYARSAQNNPTRGVPKKIKRA